MRFTDFGEIPFPRICEYASLRTDAAMFVDMRHAFETMIDIMAGELRPACRAPGHLITPPYRTINDLQVNSLWAARVSRLVEQASGWKQRRSAFGRGLACLLHYARAKPCTDRRTPRHGKLRLDFDGSITLRAADRPGFRWRKSLPRRLDRSQRFA